MIVVPDSFRRRRSPLRAGSRLGVGLLMLTLLFSGMPRTEFHSHPPEGHAPDFLHQDHDLLALQESGADQQPAGDGGQTGAHPDFHIHDATTPAFALAAGRSAALPYQALSAWILPADALATDPVDHLPLQRPPIA